MKAKVKKVLFWTGAVAVLAGTAVHLLQPLGINLLSYLGQASGVIQFLVGGVTLAWLFLFKKFKL